MSVRASVMRRRIAAALATVALATTALATAGSPVPTAAAGASRAQAGVPTLTVVPDTGIPDGGLVAVTATEFRGNVDLWQCDATLPPDLPGDLPWWSAEAALAPWCRPLTTIGGDGLPVPATGETYVDEAFQLSGRPTGDPAGVHCGDAPGDCLMLATGVVGDLRTSARTPIGLAESPLSLASSQAFEGWPVVAYLAGAPGEELGLALCAHPGPGASLDPAACAERQPVTLDPSGHAEVRVPLAARLDTPSGPVECPEYGCALAAFDAAGALEWEPLLTSSLPPLSPPALWQVVEVADGAALQVAVQGLHSSVEVALCDASVAELGDITGGPCTQAVAAPGPVDEIDTWTGTITVPRAFSGNDGSAVDCSVPWSCVVAARSDGELSATPIAFAVPDVVTLAPDAGLLDGDTMTVKASGLRPDRDYRVLHCDGTRPGGRVDAGLCDLGAGATVRSGHDGTLTTTAPALQRFTATSSTPRYCRDECRIVLVDGGPGLPATPAYGLAGGLLATTPGGPVGEGDQVTVTGTDLMASYDGPMLWIVHTGTWAVGQCDAALTADPTMAGVFRLCTVPPGGGAVDVPGSTLSAEVEAQAGFTPPIGDPVDCTTGPAACVVALVRVEQDGSFSLLTSPLTVDA